jgi:ATP-dependent helicase Lhr and Lhr-like helicase
MAETSAAFGRLHPIVQRWIWQQGWTELRDAQEAAVEPILAADVDVIIAAATASGKTEAAFLPICSALMNQEAAALGGVRVLYVSPLKALINDQYDRLDELCEHLGVAVHRWHGDVPGSKKAKLLKDPQGVLLITPESLEAIFVIHGPKVASLLGQLRYVVVDELHAFIGTERGAQLQSLLHRVELALRRRVPRIALSATLGDMTVAAEFLRPRRSRQIRLIVSRDDGQELKLQLRGYLATEPRLDARALAAMEASGAEVEVEDVTGGDQLAISEHLFAALRGTDNLVFANARREVEIYADLLARLSQRRRVPNEFWPHHGNLSKDLREHVEARLKDRSQPVNVICTSTLEMGIDIGTMTSIVQLGAPPSVSSLRQRLGRSGRAGGPAILRVYVAEAEVTAHTPPPDALRAQLVQSIAMVRLLLERWYEPPGLDDLHLSTLTQQVLSVIAQHGGVRPAEAYSALCVDGPFAKVDQQAFTALLRSLGAADLIVQSSDGTLLLGVIGERIVNHYSFYAAFTTPEEYRLVSNGRTLGTLPIDYPLSEGALLIFAGRRWRALSVDSDQRVVELTRATAGRPPLFSGTGVQVHDRVRQEMLAIYREPTLPAFLDATARDLLGEARDNFARYQLDQRMLLGWGEDTLLFPWAGDRVLGTIAVALISRGLEVSPDGVALTVAKSTPQEVQAQLEALAAEEVPDPHLLAAAVHNKRVEKYDWALSDHLLNATYAARRLDPAGAWRTIRLILGWPAQARVSS